MLRNPFLTENSTAVESDYNKSRVTASGFTDSTMNFSPSVLGIPEAEPEQVIKLKGPVPEGYIVGVHSWFDRDNIRYTKEVLIKNDPPPGVRSQDEERNRFSFTKGDDLSKTMKNYITEKGGKKQSKKYQARRDSVVDDESSEEETQINTVMPVDSISQVKPLNLEKGVRFERNSIGLNERFEQSVAISNNGSCFYNDVIGGYGQSADDKIDELDAISKIQKITGLPQIFVNSRLNFLIHLHKPLQVIMSKNGVYPCDDSLWKLSEFIRKYKTSRRDPHNDLLYQVITTTIRNDKVRANPFCLPLLEVGMYLNDKLIFISFSQLFQEYQIEWFKSMKDIEPPKFHSSYSNFSSIRQDKMNSRPQERRRKKSGSVISSLGF